MRHAHHYAQYAVVVVTMEVLDTVSRDCVEWYGGNTTNEGNG